MPASSSNRSALPSLVAMLGLVGFAFVSLRSSPETVILEWTFSRVLDFGRWAATYLAERGLELSRELLDWLLEQWERIAGPDGG